MFIMLKVYTDDKVSLKFKLYFCKFFSPSSLSLVELNKERNKKFKSPLVNIRN